MIDIKRTKYEDLQELYQKYFSFGYINTDFSSKMAIISLCCHLVKVLEKKKPDITHYQILRKCGEGIPEDIIKGMAVVCSDFAYGVSDFPVFGLSDKEIPAKLRELLNNYIPF